MRLVVLTRTFVLLAMCVISTTSYLRAQSDFGQGAVVANNPGSNAAGFNINNAIGATRFYNAGFTGQGTIVANVEAGHIWNGHESLTHVTQYAQSTAAFGNTAADLVDRHATWVGGMIGGRPTAGGGVWQQGIAFGTDLRSGAIASVWTGNAFSLGFGFDINSVNGGYQPYFGTADVINSSWTGGSPAGNNGFAVALDGFAAQNSNTTFVASAGNTGPGANTVGFPGSGYNAITVGALDNGGDNSYKTVASFSSRGPQDYADPTNGTITSARAAVDVVAPGTTLQAAFYGGQTGGNNTTLTSSTNNGTAANASSLGVAGTSFAAPIVAGGVALLKSASYNTPELAGNAASRDTLVVKSVLMNSADKTVGWNNGQVANAAGGVTTTRALDYAAGAGKMNLDRAFDQYLTAGTRDVLGLGHGNLGTVSAVGWDLGNVLLAGTNLYSIGGLLDSNSLFNVTLNWFRDRTYNPSTITISDLAQANLTLRVVDLLTNTIISESASLYNTAEHLSFRLPTTSQYGIQVSYGNNTFGSITNVNYGIAWSITAVPEPSSFVLISLVGVAGYVVHRRRQKC